MWGRIMNIDVSTYKDENSKTLMYMSEEKVRDIIEKCTDSRFLGVFGEKTVNVLKVNLRLDGIL
ncbi:potassium-transporting ATPase subunit C [Ruminococcus sp. OM08-13AT]|nr:potassium-transporting ATPase subunit C [Ruminococcus sp. OM08-13AT]RGI54465.1 potassium-transporting ATPase subunit C [Ruminococcus sp. OF05-2BH]